MSWTRRRAAHGGIQFDLPIVAGQVGRRHPPPDPRPQRAAALYSGARSGLGMRSIYSCWRHVIVAGSPDFELPLVRKARLLSFSEFIHDPECQSALINFQTAFLKPLRSGFSVEEIFHYYDRGNESGYPRISEAPLHLSGHRKPPADRETDRDNAAQCLTADADKRRGPFVHYAAMGRRSSAIRTGQRKWAPPPLHKASDATGRGEGRIRRGTPAMNGDALPSIRIQARAYKTGPRI